MSGSGLVITRWRAAMADYAGYVDHRRTAVDYLCTPAAAESVPRAARSVTVVEDIDDRSEVVAAALRIAGDHGPPDWVTGLNESDLSTAAELRDRFGCRGPRPAEVVAYRDKAVMLARIEAAGGEVPPFVATADPVEAAAFATAHRPVVVKPPTGTASAGVLVTADPHLVAERVAREGRLLVQQYDDRPVWHVDGLLRDGELARWRASRYLTSCLEFRHGCRLRSVEWDDLATVEILGRATRSWLRALGAVDTVFHVEAFYAPDQAQPPALVEVAARVGGSENATVWREVHGFDLMAEAFRLQRGRPASPGLDLPSPSMEIAGHAVVPSPAGRPCVITEVSSPVLGAGLAAGGWTPEVGEVLPDEPSFFEHVGGRFWFRGRRTAEVLSAMEAALGRYDVAGERVAAA